MREGLTKKRRQVLGILAVHADPITGPEIGEYRFFRGGRTGLREWAMPALKALEAKGFVERAGTAISNARCWQITDAGRAFLNDEQEIGRDG